jgi:hypothetical protein
MVTPDTPQRLDQAILATVAYADLFDFPLERLEVHRDLIGLATDADTTFAAIDYALTSSRLLETNGYLALPGRHELGALRQERRKRAAALRPLASHYGRRIASLPFVRLVALSGSLAAGNPDRRADLDYLIVTTPGRLWLVRAMTILLVRAARGRGVQLCPNYLLTTRALTLANQDLYTAHELLQIAPIAGAATYSALLAQNRWVADWLPNRYGQATAAQSLPVPDTFGRRLGETMLGGKAGDRLEAWEARRKQRRFGAGEHSARFTDDVCEGHYGRARERVLRDFAGRCAQLGVGPPAAHDPAAEARIDAGDSLAAGDK